MTNLVHNLIAVPTLMAITLLTGQSRAEITAVVNAANFQSGLPSGGSLATIFCSAVGNLKPGTYTPSSLPLPNTLGGLSVTVNNGFAPLLAVVVTSSGEAQINFQVPMERNASLVPDAAGAYSGSLLACGATIAPLMPRPNWGGFFADLNGYAIALHSSDYTLVTPQSPARPGETIIVYADDFFPVWPPPPVGFQTPVQPLFQIPPPELIYSTYLVGSTLTHLYLQQYPTLTCPPPGGSGQCDNSFATTPALQVTFEGLAPGLVGVEQINFVVPANQQPGDWALFFNIGSCPDGSGPPGRCGFAGGKGLSSPYVKLPVR